ncbi:MAG TPA: UDP-N-acetylglucosamine 1-carboxyvinyltransferase [Candidatus Saccharimonadales bacterium]|nr:UDP-N-acetylglucosamine 1-carboxyvinyltransferase [Candidatus Saccharimonadales bacterium]
MPTALKVNQQTKLIVTGGQPLVGEVVVSGAKNAATKMMIAALLTREEVILTNCPMIDDVIVAGEMIEAVGGKVEFGDHSVRINAANLVFAPVAKPTIPNRLSVLALSPLLHRLGQADLPTVTGDKIGPRPVDFHLQLLRKMGADITESDGRYAAKAGRLKGVSVNLPYPSVMATENALLAGVLADGRTTITNAAIEPEIVDLIKMLQQMGAIIEFRANRMIIIDGVNKLRGIEYSVMPDRLEAASYALLAIASGGDILVHGARQDDMITFLNTLRRIGADYIIEDDAIRFKRNGGPLVGVEIETDPHPGFATDWQQPMVVLLTQANGRSTVHETVHESRFGYVETLIEMGANIQVTTDCLGNLPCRYKGKGFKHSAIITGPTPLHSTKIVIPDLRAGMAHVIAALVASGTSEITGLGHLMRGYENLFDKLASVGAKFNLT